MKRGVVAVMLLWLLWPLAGEAQELMPSAWQYYIEQLSDEGDDESVEEMLELYDALHDSPVNLNDTANLLPAIPFVSDLQRERLRAYIMLSGSLLSVEELGTADPRQEQPGDGHRRYHRTGARLSRKQI